MYRFDDSEQLVPRVSWSRAPILHASPTAGKSEFCRRVNGAGLRVLDTDRIWFMVGREQHGTTGWANLGQKTVGLRTAAESAISIRAFHMLIGTVCSEWISYGGRVITNLYNVDFRCGLSGQAVTPFPTFFREPGDLEAEDQRRVGTGGRPYSRRLVDSWWKSWVDFASLWDGPKFVLGKGEYLSDVVTLPDAALPVVPPTRSALLSAWIADQGMVDDIKQ